MCRARALNGSPVRKSAVTADTALRLSKALGTTAGFWPCAASIRASGHRPESLQQMLVELVAHLLHDRKRLGVGKRLPVGPLLHQRGVDIDDRGQPHDVPDLVAAQAIGISGT